MEPNDAGGSLGPEIGVFVLRVFLLSWSGVRWAEGEELTRGGANDYSGFLEYNSVDGGVERRALNVVFELVAAALGGASKFAATNLGLVSPRGDPRVAPGAEHFSGHGWGGGFSEVDGFFELVVEDGWIFFRCFCWYSRRIC